MGKFAETFWTPYEFIQTIDGGKQLRGKDFIGKDFIVITEKDETTYDFREVGAMYIIEFDGGIVIEAYPEEVETEWQIKNGREKNPKGFY